MRRPLKLMLGMSFVVIAAVAPGAPRAESAREAETATSPRALNGHVFTPSPYVVSPFSTTHLGSHTGFGYATATSARFNLQGEVIGERDYDLAGYGNNVQYQYRFADWLAARVTGNLTLFSGIDGESALAAGASFRYSVGLGLTSGFRIGDSIRLAFVIDAAFQPAIDLTIREAVLRAIERGTADGGGDAFVLGKTVEYRPGLSFAWAPLPLLGLSAEVRYVYIDIEDSSSQDPSAGDAVDMAVLADVDFGAISSWNIALTGLYRQQEPTNDEGFRIQNAALGLFYTARPHLAAGVTLTKQWFNVRPTIDAEASLVHILMRYYW
jgi:hypothetical protein